MKVWRCFLKTFWRICKIFPYAYQQRLHFSLSLCSRLHHIFWSLCSVFVNFPCLCVYVCVCGWGAQPSYFRPSSSFIFTSYILRDGSYISSFSWRMKAEVLLAVTVCQQCILYLFLRLGLWWLFPNLRNWGNADLDVLAAYRCWHPHMAFAVYQNFHVFVSFYQICIMWEFCIA